MVVADDQGPLLLTWINFNLIMAKYYIHYKVMDGFHPFLNFNSATVEVWEWINNFTHTLMGMRLLIYAGIEVSPCQ